VHAGDTLTSIAMALWGDSSLWWMIADANGLSLNEPLIPNTVLTVPNKVTNIHNNSSTFKPYDAGKAIGDTNPTIPNAPPPPPPPGKKGCGGVLQIVSIAVAVAVTAMSAGTLGPVAAAMLGSVAGQGVLMAGGAQKGLDFKSVALAGVTGGVAKGVNVGGLASSNSFVAGAIDGAITATATNVVGSITGMQSFSWKNIAAATVSSGVARGVSRNLPGAGTATKNPAFGNQLASQVAGGIGSAAVYGNLSQQALLGTTMNAIASTIGNSVAGQMKDQSAAKAGNTSARTNPVQTTGNGDFLFGADYGTRNPYADAVNAHTGNASPSTIANELMALGQPLGVQPVTTGMPSNVSWTDFSSHSWNVTDFTYLGQVNGESHFQAPNVTVTPADGYTPYYADLAQWATQYNRPLPPLTRDSHALGTYYNQQYAQTAPAYGQYSRDVAQGQMSPLQRSQYLYQEAYNKLTPDQQSAVFEQNFKAWRDADTKSFLNFNAQIAFMGATAGLSAGVPFLAAANAARGSGTVSTVVGYGLATRVGTGVISGAIDAGAQLMTEEKFKWTNVAVSTATGMLGVGGGIRWNMAINASGGFVQTALNNQKYGTNDNVFVGAAVSGVSGGAGYLAGTKATSLIAAQLPRSTIPVIGGSVAGSSFTEITNTSISHVKENVDKWRSTW
jgi:hypothetical protein